MFTGVVEAIIQRIGWSGMLIKRTGVVVVVLAAMVLATLTYTVLRNLNQQHAEVQEWQSRNLTRQVEWLWVSTRITKYQQLLLVSVSNLVAGKPGATKGELINDFDVYWSWYNSLDAFNGSYYDLLLSDEHFDEDTREMIVDLGRSAASLQQRAAEHLQRLELLVLGVEPADTVTIQAVLQEIESVQQDLTALGEGVVTLMRQSMQAQESFSQKLTQRLFYAFLIIAGVVSLGVFGMGSYVLQKLESNSRLRGLNKKLTAMYTQQSRQSRLMEKLAYYDSLSGLFNREGYYRELRRVLGQGGSHGVVFLDLDMFNVVNNTAGRKGGDDLISQIGKALLDCCAQFGCGTRSADCVCTDCGCTPSRLGDDEFAFLCQNYSEQEFERFVDNLQQIFSPLVFTHKDRQYRLTASIGAYYFASDAHTDDTVMERADAACLDAKRLGGNRARYYTDQNSLVPDRQKDLNIIEQIHNAFDHNRFVLYYQPIVALTGTGYRPYSYELLIRMHASDGTLVPPGAFLGVAERYGLMPKIDRWVVNEAFDWLEQNDIREQGLTCLNINLSGLSINDDEWIEKLVEEISKRDIDPGQVCFEITESSALYRSGLGNLNALKAAGVRLSLDDFGSGFSSFEYLENLPVDQVKIDGAFVKDLDSNATHQEFIRAIAAMCIALEKFTVGEFVENEASIYKLRELGVQCAQGYHIAAPAMLWNTTAGAQMSSVA